QRPPEPHSGERIRKNTVNPVGRKVCVSLSILGFPSSTAVSMPFRAIPCKVSNLLSLANPDLQPHHSAIFQALLPRQLLEFANQDRVPQSCGEEPFWGGSVNESGPCSRSRELAWGPQIRGGTARVMGGPTSAGGREQS